MKERIIENEELMIINQRIKRLKKYKRKAVFKKGLSGLTLAGMILLIPSIATTVGMRIGHSPFKRDDVTKRAHIRTEFNNDEVKNVTKKYETYEDEKSLVHYHTGWTNEDDQYVSEVVTYDASGLTYDEVSNGIKEGNVEEILGKTISTEKVYKDTITEEEKKENPYYEGVLYRVDETDTIVEPQNENENSNDFGACIVVPGLAGLVFGLYGFQLTNQFDTLLSSETMYINQDLREAKSEKKKLVKKLK